MPAGNTMNLAEYPYAYLHVTMLIYSILVYRVPGERSFAADRAKAVERESDPTIARR